MIGNYNATDILLNIKENHISIKKIKESLSDNRASYRAFAINMGLDELALSEFIPKIE